MRHDEPAGEERVAEELAALAADPDSAPDVPAEVTTRVLTALRTAEPAHTDRPLRWRRTALAFGVAAGLAALGLGAAALSGPASPARSTGPTAEQITVARRPAPMPLTDSAILALLTRPADLGVLAQPQRWGACLRGLRRDPAVPVLGAAPVAVAGRPAVLVVFPGNRPDEVQAVALDSDCDATHDAAITATTLPRP